jgi:hypothetical protein
MKRVVLAVAVVVALVASAFALRAARSSDAPADAERPTRVVCAPDMAAACAALAGPDLEVQVEPATTTIARLLAGDALQADAWLTPRPWFELARARTAPVVPVDPFGTPSEVIARSPLVLIVRSDRRSAIESTCNGVLDWFCLARTMGEPWAGTGADPTWGTVAMAVDDPTQRTTGLLALAQMGATFTRRAVFDWRDLDAVRSTVTSVLTRLPAPADRPALDVMLERGGVYDGAFALEAGSRIAIASPRASGQLELVAPAPVVSADAVLVPSGGSTRPIDLEAVRRALTSTGWQFPDRAESGVPDATSFEALLALWTVARPPR